MNSFRQILAVRWQSALLVLLLPAVAGADEAQPVLRKIVYERHPIFSQSDRERVPWLPLGLADRLHADTRLRVIRRELAVEPGKPLDQELVEESERKLRRLGFFSTVELQPIPVSPDSVDLLVRTREVWTMEFSADYERFEGRPFWSASLRERNFLGMARSFAVSRSKNEDRSSWGLALGDRQMFDGTWRGAVGVADSDDGNSTAWSLEKPFFHLGATWGVETDYYNVGARQRFYINSSQYIRPQVQNSGFQAFLLRRWAVTESGVWRWGVGVGGEDQRFTPESGLPVYDSQGQLSTKATLNGGSDESRNLRYATVSLRRVTRRYAKLGYIDAMGQVEDVALGGETELDVGWATRAYDGSLAGLRLSGDQSWAGRHAGQLLRAGVTADGVISTGKAVNLRLRGGVTSHVTLHPDWRVAATVQGGTGSGLDRHRLYSLGIDSGLRAASFREFAGDRIVRGNLELRWVHRPGLLGLVTPGLTAFADLGSAWYERERDLRWKELRGALGVGLRIGFRQGSQFVPMRLDLAWPVLYDIDRPKPVLSIGTGQVF